jgi:nitroimidazol reductase NimA-like FMN-containing flavoprotein (pyridoxamine 5'-phosphate oxidase superfamily)
VTAISQERIPLVYQKFENWIFSLDRLRSTFCSMRKEIYRMDRAGAEALLARASVVRVAGVSSSGAPVLRAVHGVIVDGALAFHGARAGEKMEAVGREAVASADETVASIPSYFVDPERACPATTYYLSAQVHGVIERVDDPAAKARVLSALMAKFQPEGGHVPIDPSHPLYTKAIAGILVLRIPLERLDGKAKLAQNRSPAELGRILQKLWERGLPSDPRAIDLVRVANPGHDEPSFLRAAAPPRLRTARASPARSTATPSPPPSTSSRARTGAKASRATKSRALSSTRPRGSAPTTIAARSSPPAAPMATA